MAAKRVRASRRKRAPQRGRRGRPFVHDETWSKVSVVLFERQIVLLDRVVNEIRRNTGRALNRAAIIRAVIDGVLDSGFRLSAAVSEADLKQRIARLLRTSAVVAI